MGVCTCVCYLVGRFLTIFLVHTVLRPIVPYGDKRLVHVRGLSVGESGVRVRTKVYIEFRFRQSSTHPLLPELIFC